MSFAHSLPSWLRQFGDILRNQFPQDVEELRRRAQTAILEVIREKPSEVLSRAGLTPDPWQSRVLRSDFRRILLLCSRQSGKTETASALALKTALLDDNALVLILSPTLRQSGELFRQKVLKQWRALGRPRYLKAPTQLQLELSNGS